VQTKEYNAYLTLWQQGLITPAPPSPEDHSEPASPESTFPNFVLLMVSQEPWE